MDHAHGDVGFLGRKAIEISLRPDDGEGALVDGGAVAQIGLSHGRPRRYLRAIREISAARFGRVDVGVRRGTRRAVANDAAAALGADQGQRERAADERSPWGNRKCGPRRRAPPGCAAQGSARASLRGRGPESSPTRRQARPGRQRCGGADRRRDVTKPSCSAAAWRAAASDSATPISSNARSGAGRTARAPPAAAMRAISASASAWAWPNASADAEREGAVGRRMKADHFGRRTLRRQRHGAARSSAPRPNETARVPSRAKNVGGASRRSMRRNDRQQA